MVTVDSLQPESKLHSPVLMHQEHPHLFPAQDVHLKHNVAQSILFEERQHSRAHSCHL